MEYNASEEIYWQWLCSCPSLTRTQFMALEHSFHSARAVYEAPASSFEEYRRVGLRWADSLITYKNSCDLEKCEKLLKSRGLCFLSRWNALFPEKLQNLPDCPYGLFYKGRMPDPNTLSVAVIGARRCSNYGSRMAAYLGAQLARRHVQVISGMAAGIDGMSQRACVAEEGSSFAVLGCGADICYPPENKSLYQSLPVKGGILSEFGPATPPLAMNFPFRNRLISGLADAVIVVEARKKSGSLITVDMALDQGKEVYAVPGRFGDELSYGCNHLIEQGAGLLSSVDQVLDDLKDRAGKMPPLKKIRTAQEVIMQREADARKEKKKEVSLQEKRGFDELNGMELRIYEHLDMDPQGFDRLMEETDLSMMELMRGLLSLQMKGYAAEVSKGRFARASV